jgi:hypothetical protein
MPFLEAPAGASFNACDASVMQKRILSAEPNDAANVRSAPATRPETKMPDLMASEHGCHRIAP